MMKTDIFYKTAAGRALMKLLWKTGAMKLAVRYLRSGASRPYIARYIKKNRIDMTGFEGQEYDSFAAFFARRKNEPHYVIDDPEELISPCDGRVTVYPITEGTEIPMKGSLYRLDDLILDEEAARQFRGGLCLVFRLEASDYHHFCCFDDMTKGQTHMIPGQLHSVQPIACRSVPVYRLNRRWWTMLDTAHFGRAAQIEIGAVLVGGVTHADGGDWLPRGAELGNFELAGSTVVLLLDASVRRRLELYPALLPAMRGEAEVPAKMGDGIGRLRDE